MTDILIEPIHKYYVDVESIDSLSMAYQDCADKLDRLRGFKSVLVDAMWELTNGDKKTRHLEGERFKAKLTESNRTPNPAVLKDLWQTTDNLTVRDRFLRVSGVAINLKEYKKLDDQDPQDEEVLRVVRMIKSAISTGSPGYKSVAVDTK